MKRFLRLPSPAMAVALVALFTAMAGSAYAATVITGSNVKNGSLTGADLKNGTVGEKQVGASTLLGGDIKDGSLAARDVKAGSLTADRFKAGEGLKGPKGDPGAPGSPAKASRWVLVNAAGQIDGQSGGFTVKAAYPTLAPTGTDATGLRANGNVYIDSGEDLTDNGIVSTMALQNATDQNNDGIMGGRAPGADNNPEFSGEISNTRCAITGVVTCAPTGTNTSTHFVVSPRNSDGTVTQDGARKRFYVVITP